MYYILIIIIALLGYWAQSNVKSKFERYSKEPFRLTGREIAEKMLHENGIYDVRVTSTPGQLTDHYNPTTKTVNLSEGVYNQATVAAAAVAAHECGHAVQHAKAYAPLRLRSALVPAVSFASNIVQIVLLIGIVTVTIYPKILLAGIVLFGLTTLFSLITLPVEIDASRRALAWLSHTGLTGGAQQRDAEDALRAAAYTYVVAALSSLITLLYYIMIFLGGRRRD
jgi:Zn-dependent membrane protease YugP